ncbi:MAG TPA: HPF/RaiA family ribosome-associated protein [Terriglobales bacterium]|nr:HPF/RaiA family ribosome-associated protein [Terriglobales bacterium]
MNVHLTVQVPRSPELNQIMDRFQHKLDGLLFAFQPELVQLQGRLVRHTSREGVSCRLNLHLPTGQLSSEEAAGTAQAAFRAASNELTRQLNKHKQRLRETRPRLHLAAAATRGRWRAQSAASRVAAAEATPTRWRPQPAASRAAALNGYLGAHEQHLLGFVRRQIELRERLGELPVGWLDPYEVLNEVVVAALGARPGAQAANRGRWFLLLAAAAMRRLAKAYSDQPHGQPTHSLDQAAPAFRRATAFVGDEDEVLRLQDVVASDHANPEETAVASETMERLAAALAGLPRQPRHDLVLYLLEGFRPQELAQLTKRSEADVLESLERAEAALRQQPELPQLLADRLRPLPARAPRAPAGARRARALVPQRA